MRRLVWAPIAILVACAAFPRPVEEPRVDVREVTVRFDERSRMFVGTIDLDVTNPNSIGLPLRGITYSLEVAGQSLPGEVEMARTIPARGTAPVRAMLAASPASALSGGTALALGRRDYKVTGVLHFTSSLGKIEVPFRQEGRL